MINTSDQEDEIIKQAIQKVILNVLAAFTEKERLDIKTRQDGRIEGEKAKGKHLGRSKATVTPRGNKLLIHGLTMRLQLLGSLVVL
ncbi:hypothetical protein GT022_08425 [Agaribacter marinus]|uniref:Uncharacterized protein n=1 Tax=Virgibacillus salarius TaxID=447199 RepID=A0A941DV49_9BACI|nr:hypothetical protein [Virgibacillus salarius]MBR7796072.1 hypothetical protein [Virgibacillus salarius]NAZ08783.1 hypothetical protein [Agaribacter marinus]